MPKNKLILSIDFFLIVGTISTIRTIASFFHPCGTIVKN
jgi:hypothetical protein